jgi:hypothetical protein
VGDAKETFRTYANYIRALAELASFPILTLGSGARLARVAERIHENVVAVAPQRQPDVARVRASLVNAWGTEMILNVTMTYAQEDELVGLTNNWAAVQLYYSAYHSTQALLVARGYDRPQSHEQTQRMFGDLWVNRVANLPPWSIGMGPSGIRNGPNRDVDHTIHSWSACTSQSCWDLSAKALRTTRDDVVAAAMHRARLEKQRARRRTIGEQPQHLRSSSALPLHVALPRLTGEEKHNVQQRVRTFTFLDFLYRVRIKTNYEDAAVFVEGPDSPAQARLVRRDLAHLAASTSLLNEIHIQLLIGAQVVREWAQEWVANNHPGGRPLGLASRLPLL